MATIEIRINYDEVENGSKQFNQQQSSIGQVNRRLKSAKDALHGGKGWVGQAATEFFKEFDNELMPAMNRLERAMGSASRVSKQVNKIMQEAEDQWKVIFKF